MTDHHGTVSYDDGSADAKTEYQLILTFGLPIDVAEQLGDAAVDLTVDRADPDAVLAMLDGSRFTPADLRSRALVAVSEDADPAAVTMLYAALLGFAARHLDVASRAGVIGSAALHGAAARRAKDERPDDRDEVLHVVAEGAETGVAPAVTLAPGSTAGGVDAETATRIRFAKRVVLHPTDSVMTTLPLLLITAGLRRRGAHDRLPDLLAGGDGDVEGAEGVWSLDALRQRAGESRRSQRGYDADALAPQTAPTRRQQRLREAAGVAVEDALRLLGSRFNEEAGAWHCPRPERHARGDRNPSTRINDGMVRCFGVNCDAEYLDPVRLAADALSVTPDEAAEVLLRPDDELSRARLQLRRQEQPSLAPLPG